MITNTNYGDCELTQSPYVDLKTLGQKLNSLGLCIEGDKKSWDLKKILIAIADNISMNAKPWKRGISNIDKTVKEIYGTREDFKKELFETYKEELV